MKWRVDRLGAVHWGLWSPTQSDKRPPICQCGNGGEIALREIARRLNIYESLLRDEQSRRIIEEVTV